ncbi:MAG: type II toxin-antitoxin system VapC family toxin [Deltaproteobacteria bacterium]|nr:type II toxin-antitoxin system VapC family toxin [Deltaproteobacteria bacterium]
MKRAVIDASVVLKWYLPDEKYGGKALALLTRYISEDLEIAAPSLLEFEVINALVIAQRRGRIREEKIIAAIEGFINLGISLTDLSDLYSKIIHYCKAYNRSAYDASYLAVADREAITLITADEGLYNSVKKDLSWVKWLGDI